jgi:phage-related protein
MELRKSSEVGLPNESGHLSTYERHASLMQEKEMFEKIHAQRERELHDLEKEMSALNATESAKLQKKLDELKEGIHLHDLENTRTQVHTLNRLLNDIREKQQFQMNRLSAHYSLNQNSHRRMVLTSLLETILYIGVSIFQVYTIRRWFRGSSLLGY